MQLGRLQGDAGGLAGGIREDIWPEVAGNRRQDFEHGFLVSVIVAARYVQQLTHEPTVLLYSTIRVEV